MTKLFALPSHSPQESSPTSRPLPPETPATFLTRPKTAMQPQRECRACLSLLVRFGPTVHITCVFLPSLPAAPPPVAPSACFPQLALQLVLLLPSASSSVHEFESATPSTPPSLENPPVEPFLPAADVTLVDFEEEHTFPRFACLVSSVVCKAFVCEKKLLPARTIAWIQSLHESSADGAVSAFSICSAWSDKFWSTFYLSHPLGRPLLQGRRHSISPSDALAADPVQFSESEGQSRPVPADDLLGEPPGSTAPYVPTSSR